MEDKILKLTKLWYEYVGMDNHKDQDCHWFINKIWSYGDEPYYKIIHDGYFYEAKNYKRYKTYAAAEKALCSEMHKAFKEELKWAKDVVAFASAYDKTQIEKAKWFIENYLVYSAHASGARYTAFHAEVGE